MNFANRNDACHLSPQIPRRKNAEKEWLRVSWAWFCTNSQGRSNCVWRCNANVISILGGVVESFPRLVMGESWVSLIRYLANACDIRNALLFDTPALEHVGIKTSFTSKRSLQPWTHATCISRFVPYPGTRRIRSKFDSEIEDLRKDVVLMFLNFVDFFTK